MYIVCVSYAYTYICVTIFMYTCMSMYVCTYYIDIRMYTWCKCYMYLNYITLPRLTAVFSGVVHKLGGAY